MSAVSSRRLSRLTPSVRRTVAGSYSGTRATVLATATALCWRLTRNRILGAACAICFCRSTTALAKLPGTMCLKPWHGHLRALTLTY